jgi:hypothetical protein
VTPPIWEPAVLTGARGAPGHWCAGFQGSDRAARAARRVGRTRRWRRKVRTVGAARPASAMGVGVPVSVPWEKCGRCAGLPALGVVGWTIDDVPASELSLRHWVVESPRDGRGFEWIFHGRPALVRPRGRRIPWRRGDIRACPRS